MDGSGVVFYVGMTKGLEVRVYAHRQKFGKLFTYKVLEELMGTKKDALAAEKKWILHYATENKDLVNKNKFSNEGLASIGICGEILNEVKVVAAEYGFTIRQLLELGANWVMTEGKEQYIREINFEKSGIIKNIIAFNL